MAQANSTFQQRRRAATKRAIVDAAMDRLAAEGLEGLTMRGLARDLGCTEPALYRYFASKDALLATLTEEVVNGLGALLERGVDASDDPLVRAVLASEIYGALMRERRGEAALLTLVLGDPRYLVDHDASAPTVDAVGRMLGRVEKCLQDAVVAGALREGDAMARSVMLWTAAHGAAQLRKFDRFGVPHLGVARVRRNFLSDLLTAWGATPSSLEPALDQAVFIAAELIPAHPQKEQ